MINRLIRYIEYLTGLKNSNTLRKIQSEIFVKKIREESKTDLINFGWKFYSQNDEDGIINEIFRRIKTTNKFFVEIGSGGGYENNTLNLLCEGWQGAWIDANTDYIKKYEKTLASKIPKNCLQLLEIKLNSKNTNFLKNKLNIPDEIDFLSLDIDSHETDILENLNFSPRVICVEYNAKFRENFKFKFSEDERSDIESDFWGNSLSSLNDCLDKKGYSLIGCNITGVNAFFVKKELAIDNFYLSNDLRDFYMPPRYYLSYLFSSSDGSLETILKRIRNKHH
tara:strand:- start:22839 stop:23681 length:843 start_codon:yes stop_codon:yes gene_type:complete